MKIFKFLTALMLLCSAQMAFARNACDPCDPCGTRNDCSLCDIDFCDVEYSVYADYLYWRVSKSDLNDDDDGFVNPAWDHGFRLGGVARHKNWDFGVRWTAICTSDKKHGDKFEIDYDVVDIELGYKCCMGCGNFVFRPFAGAKLAWIEEDFDLDDKLDYKGYGLYLGAEGRWELCSFCACDNDIPVALVTRASTGILDSRFKADFGGHDDESECLHVPYHDVFAGLEFSYSGCGCADLNMLIGYEAQYWGWRESNSSDDIAHLGLGGLVLRFGANF